MSVARGLARLAARPLRRPGIVTWGARAAASERLPRREASEPWAAVLAIAGGALLLGARGPPACEDQGVDVKVTTYNVLAPKLCNAKHYPKCPPGTTEHEARLPKVMARMESAVANRTIIGLQEVDLLWAGKLHVFFAERGYHVAFAQYGKQFNGYMGVLIAWPCDKYEALDVDISRVSDTAPAGTWPKAGANSGLAPFGFLTWWGMKEVLGCAPPDQSVASEDWEWKAARDRFNETVMVRLRPRGEPQSPSFCVATYHMPCFFGPPEKVRVVNIHTYLLLRKLRDFSAGDPAILMGDFNFQPHSSSYALAASGGSFEAAAGRGLEELQGLGDRLPAGAPWPQGLESAYKAFHKMEPLFTNFAQTSGQSEPFVETLDYIWYSPGVLRVVDCPPLPETREGVAGPFPNTAEPSDHLPLHATFRLGQGTSKASGTSARL